MTSPLVSWQGTINDPCQHYRMKNPHCPSNTRPAWQLEFFIRSGIGRWCVSYLGQYTGKYQTVCCTSKPSVIISNQKKLCVPFKVGGRCQCTRSNCSCRLRGETLTSDLLPLHNVEKEPDVSKFANATKCRVFSLFAMYWSKCLN